MQWMKYLQSSWLVQKTCSHQFDNMFHSVTLAIKYLNYHDLDYHLNLTICSLLWPRQSGFFFHLQFISMIISCLHGFNNTIMCNIKTRQFILNKSVNFNDWLSVICNDLDTKYLLCPWPCSRSFVEHHLWSLQWTWYSWQRNPTPCFGWDFWPDL